MKSKDSTSKSLHAKFYGSRIKASELGGGGKYAPPVWSVFKSPGKIGLIGLIGLSFTDSDYEDQDHSNTIKIPNRISQISQEKSLTPQGICF